MKLEPNMSPEVQDFFSEPDDIVNKLVHVLDFQKKHRTLLTAHWMDLNRKYTFAKAEVKRLSDLAFKMNDTLKEANRQLKYYKSVMKSQSVASSSYTSPPMAAAQSRNSCSLPRHPHSARSNGLPPVPTVHVTLPPMTHQSHSQYSQVYQSNLVTPDRLSQHRHSVQMSVGSQKSHHSYTSGNVVPPVTPGSIGSNYSTASSSIVLSQQDPLSARQPQRLLPSAPPARNRSLPKSSKSENHHVSDQFKRMSLERPLM